MTEIRTAIPAYAGQSDVAARRLSDQQVRAWVGERLAALRDRLGGAAGDALDDAIVHCEFGDQRVIRALEDSRLSDAGNASAVEASDTAFLAAAAGAESVDAAGLGAFVDALTAAQRARTGAIVALAPERRKR